MPVDWVSTLGEFVDANLGAIIVGILVSVIVLLLQTLVRASSIVLAAWLGKTSTLAPVWGFSRASRLSFVSGSIHGVTPGVRQAVLMGPDADAANEAIATMRFLRPNLELVRSYSTSHPEEELKENIIAIGGPVNNSVTEKFMSYMSEYVAFEKVVLNESETYTLRDKISNASKEASYDESDSVVHDFGLILKAPNPLAPLAEILVLAGLDSHGVLAAARAISLHPDGKPILREIRKQLGAFAYFRRNYYFAIVECDALGNDIGGLQLVEFHRLSKPKRENQRKL